MTVIKPGMRSLGLSLLAIVLFLLAACAQPVTYTPTPLPTIKASLLAQLSQDDLRWFRDVAVPKGTDAYEFTQLATAGAVKATWYPQYRSHFVEAILGKENQGTYYWLTFLWDEGQKKWEPLPVGADLFSVKDGHVLAWVYSDTSQNPAPPPAATP